MLLVNQQQAIERLLAGEIVCLPTDTLYAMCALATDELAVNKVYVNKKRAADKAPPLFVHSIEAAEKWAKIDDDSRYLMQHFWPGACTLILPVHSGRLPSNAYNTTNNTVALRMPNHAVLLSVLEKINAPITGTSVNISGQEALQDPEEIGRAFPEMPILWYAVDKKANALPSTIVEVQDNKKIYIHRHGALSADLILSTLARQDI